MPKNFPAASLTILLIPWQKLHLLSPLFHLSCVLCNLKMSFLIAFWAKSTKIWCLQFWNKFPLKQIFVVNLLNLAYPFLFTHSPYKFTSLFSHLADILTDSIIYTSELNLLSLSPPWDAIQAQVLHLPFLTRDTFGRSSTTYLYLPPSSPSSHWKILNYKSDQVLIILVIIWAQSVQNPWETDISWERKGFRKY